MHTLAIVLANMGGICFLLAGALMYQEIGEVNRKLPDEHQISYFFFHAEKVSKIKREFKRLYPESPVDGIRVAAQTLGIIFVLLAAVASGFFKFWPFR